MSHITEYRCDKCDKAFYYEPVTVRARYHKRNGGPAETHLTIVPRAEMQDFCPDCTLRLAQMGIGAALC